MRRRTAVLALGLSASLLLWDGPQQPLLTAVHVTLDTVHVVDDLPQSRGWRPATVTLSPALGNSAAAGRAQPRARGQRHEMGAAPGSAGPPQRRRSDPCLLALVRGAMAAAAVAFVVLVMAKGNGQSSDNESSDRQSSDNLPAPAPAPAPEVMWRFLQLRTGSDIRGIAELGSGTTPDLDPQTLFCFGSAFIQWLRDRDPSAGLLTVALGRDPRVHGARLLTACAEGCAAVGAAVTDVGLATTPAMFEACADTGGYFRTTQGLVGGHDGAVMVTASHLPSQWNGLKFFTRDGGLAATDVMQICKLAARCQPQQPPPAPGCGTQHDPDYLVKGYAALLRQRVLGSVDLRGLKVAVNAGHGAGGFIAGDVLAPQGADVSASVALAPDGRFPSHPPNPESPAAVAATVATVVRGGADLGLIFDTDVDRSGVVLGPRGPEPPLVVTRNRLIALMSGIVLRAFPGTVIVTDSVTSEGLTRYIARAGGVHVRAKKGYRTVIEEARRIDADPRLPDCHLAIETSGHGALKENAWLDDGAYMAMTIVRLAAQEGGVEGLREMLGALQEPVQSTELRLRVAAGHDVSQVCDTIVRAMQRAAERGVPRWSPDPTQPEGFRVRVAEGEGKRGWLMVRRSLHEPIVTFFAENEVSNGLARSLRELMDHVLCELGDDVLDLDPLRPYVRLQ